jgi:hypothetical protein
LLLVSIAKSFCLGEAGGVFERVEPSVTECFNAIGFTGVFLLSGSSSIAESNGIGDFWTMSSCSNYSSIVILCTFVGLSGDYNG